MKRSMYTAVLVLAVLAILPCAAQESTTVLASLLRPAFLSLGVLPNLDGLVDGNLAGRLVWNPYLSSSIDAAYSAASEEASDSSDNAILKAKAFSKEYSAEARLLDFFLALGQGSSGLGLSAALACSYDGTIRSISGYKTALAETVYFNQDTMVHRVAPSVDVGLSAALGGVLSMDLSGTFLPWVYLYEQGSKLYSTYAEAIPYTLQNSCMGWKARAVVATLSLPIGDIMLDGAVMGLFGHYATRQDVVTGNYRTIISTYDLYQAIEVDAAAEYRMGFLRDGIGLVPALRVGLSASYESFDGIATKPGITWRGGITLGSR